mmetsp:Transcript_1301/g.1624  ORF Transcript_1301/g.1624 Transcript_1301/m.1624 type:complete len:112 (+) Transcript_1301:2206-2541(+)
MAVLKDCLMIVFIITPMFVAGLRFWTAPAYLNYRRKFNSFLVPFAMVPLHLGTSWDVFLLGLLVAWMNFYVFWYHTDPPMNVYQLSRKKGLSEKMKAKLESQQDRRAKHIR